MGCGLAFTPDCFKERGSGSFAEGFWPEERVEVFELVDIALFEEFGEVDFVVGLRLVVLGSVEPPFSSIGEDTPFDVFDVLKVVFDLVRGISVGSLFAEADVEIGIPLFGLYDTDSIVEEVDGVFGV